MSLTASQAVCDTGNDRAVTNDLSHVLKFTGHKVNLTGAHGKALPMQGALCAFPTVDVKGKSCTITKFQDYGGYVRCPGGEMVVMSFNVRIYHT